MVEQVHDLHHYEHSPPLVGLLFMVFFDEWLRVLLGFSNWFYYILMLFIDFSCCKPSFGFATKAKGLQGCGPRRSPGVTSHTPRSVRKCEGVRGSESSHSQGNSHFRRWSPGGLPKLHKAISGVKTQCLVAFFISLESFWNLNV